MRQVQVFYNRQIRNIERRLDRLRRGEESYDIYSSEWGQISENVRQRDGNQCRRCGISEAELREAGSHLTVHHIVARADGGSNWPSNLITLCVPCHREVENAPELL
jgi:5-methylcytosine-specific restriction endonuclease McrA